MVSPKTVLVTGCAGFIGSNFVKQFFAKFPNTKIIGIDNFETGRKEDVHPLITFYKASILDHKVLEKIFAKHKPEYVFHFAARPRISFSVENPRYTSDINITGTAAVLEASKNHRVKRVIYSSSSSVYGTAKKLPATESENPPDPQSPYSLQKYVGEEFCKMFSKLYGLDTVTLRYFTVFGPGQYGDSPYATVICAWLESLYFPDNKKGFIEGDGTQSRDFSYVDNIVEANILAMLHKKPLKGEVFNIANSGNTTLNEVKVLIEKYTHKKLRLERRPPRMGDFRHTHADITKAERALGYSPKVSFKKGLKHTVAWFESRKK